MGYRTYEFFTCDFCEQKTTPLPTDIPKQDQQMGWFKLEAFTVQQVAGEKIMYDAESGKKISFCSKACLLEWLKEKLGVKDKPKAKAAIAGKSEVANSTDTATPTRS